MREESQGGPHNAKGDLNSLRKHEQSPRSTGNSKGTLSFPPQLHANDEIQACLLEEALLRCSVSKEIPRFPWNSKGSLTLSLYETPEVSRDTRPHSRGTLSFPPQVKKSPVFPASTRDEALFLCPDLSGVPRGPFNSKIFLNSHKHPEKLPEVTVTCRGKPGFPAATLERLQYSPFNAS